MNLVADERRITLTVVVITRCGTGTPWIVDTPVAARLHPLVQLADVVVSSAEHLLTAYGRHASADLCRLMPSGLQREQISVSLERWREKDTSSRRAEALAAAEDVWRSILRTAQSPPTDPTELVRLIVEDRRAIEGISIPVRGESRTMNEHVHTQTHTPEAKPTKAPKAEKVKTEGATRAPRVADSAVVSVGSNKDGVSFAEANPKRAGTPSAERFAKYRDGMTVGEAKAAGVLAGDITYDVKHGYISLTAEAEAIAA